jgi:hypothetical protein
VIEYQYLSKHMLAQPRSQFAMPTTAAERASKKDLALVVLMTAVAYWVFRGLDPLEGTSKIWCLQRTSLNIQGRTEAAWQEPSIEDSGQIDKKAMIPWSDLMQTPSGSKCAGDTEES